MTTETGLFSCEEVLGELLEYFPDLSVDELLTGWERGTYDRASNFAFLPKWLPSKRLNTALLSLPYKLWKRLGKVEMQKPKVRLIAAPFFFSSQWLAVFLGNARTATCSEEELLDIYRSIGEMDYLLGLLGFNYFASGGRFYKIYPMLREFVEDGAEVLDYGAGPAAFSLALAYEKHCQVTLLDVKSQMSDFALWRFKRRDLPVQFLHADKFGGEKRQYDAVICFDVLEHLLNPVAVLQEITGRIRPGGHLLLNLPEMGHGYGHLRQAKRDWEVNGGESHLARHYSAERVNDSYRFFRRLPTRAEERT